MPAAQGLGACPAIKYLPHDQYYYVIFAGQPFVYIIRTKDFVVYEQPPQPFIRPSTDDAVSQVLPENGQTQTPSFLAAV